MKTSLAPALGLAVLVALAPSLARAQMFAEAPLEALLMAQRHGELDKLGTQRLAANPQDGQAVLARAMAAMQGNDAAQRQSVLAQAEACVRADARQAPCHYTVGVLLGVQAMSEGMLKMAGSVGRIRGALNEATTLDPGWWPARSAMAEFYLMAPGLVGGSVAKAQELARAAPKPEQTRALQARVMLSEEKFDAALAQMSALLTDLGPQARVAGDSALASDLRGWAVQAGGRLINDGQAPKAKPFFERLAREDAEHASGPYFLGRVQAETGEHAQAIKLFEQAAARPKGKNWLPIDYRLGISQQALGNKDAARLALSRFVQNGKGQKKSLEDARKRLEQLG